MRQFAVKNRTLRFNNNIYSSHPAEADVSGSAAPMAYSGSSEEEEEAPTLVIDSGSFSIKAGFAGDEVPCCTFVALV